MYVLVALRTPASVFLTIRFDGSQKLSDIDCQVRSELLHFS
jgi:hypothetical protein